MQHFFKQFSFPGGIGSHATPETPGSIHEGGVLVIHTEEDWEIARECWKLAHGFQGTSFSRLRSVTELPNQEGKASSGSLSSSSSRPRTRRLG
jgi:xylulose-5-phosphate/fructose-6-phosphate phosphoketolase